jgi:hypothetical protein
MDSVQGEYFLCRRRLIESDRAFEHARRWRRWRGVDIEMKVESHEGKSAVVLHGILYSAMLLCYALFLLEHLRPVLVLDASYTTSK